MPAACRLGDNTNGHGCFAPTPISATPVTKTFINGILASVIGADLPDHACGRDVHRNRKVSSGSGTVFIEGKAATRIGDLINCGDTMAQGSGNTFFGG
jgi:uncharacterized Zn-binding protein involved in type VI secretion